MNKLEHILCNENVDINFRKDPTDFTEFLHLLLLNNFKYRMNLANSQIKLQYVSVLNEYSIIGLMKYMNQCNLGTYTSHALHNN